MKNLLKFSTLLLFFGFVFYGCDDDGNGTNPTDTISIEIVSYSGETSGSTDDLELKADIIIKNTSEKAKTYILKLSPTSLADKHTMMINAFGNESGPSKVSLLSAPFELPAGASSMPGDIVAGIIVNEGAGVSTIKAEVYDKDNEADKKEFTIKFDVEQLTASESFLILEEHLEASGPKSSGILDPIQTYVILKNVSGEVKNVRMRMTPIDLTVGHEIEFCAWDLCYPPTAETLESESYALQADETTIKEQCKIRLVPNNFVGLTKAKIEIFDADDPTDKITFEVTMTATEE